MNILHRKKALEDWTLLLRVRHHWYTHEPKASSMVWLKAMITLILSQGIDRSWIEYNVSDMGTHIVVSDVNRAHSSYITLMLGPSGKQQVTFCSGTELVTAEEDFQGFIVKHLPLLKGDK